MIVEEKVLKTLKENAIERIVDDLDNMLKESKLQDGNYKIKINLVREGYNNNADLFVIEGDKVLLSRKYLYSKLERSLELAYKDNKLLFE